MSLVKQLFSHVEMTDTCWKWQGAKTAFGHGRIKVRGRLYSPHRLVLEMFKGPLKPGELALHKCDDPSCVNPQHLFKGSHSDNMKDCAAKGRLAVQKDPTSTQGEHRPTAKLNDEKVREIRMLAANGAGPTHLAKAYGVHRSVIQKVIKRERWAHVTDF